MASAVKYIANVGKSVKYATVDVLKELNPVVKDTIETNEDILKVTYSSIKNFKTLSAKAMKTFSESQVGELAKDLKKNLMEDIKNGTFYNKKREESMTSSIVDEEYGASMEDFFVDDDDFSVDDFSVEGTIESVGERSTTAISNVLARTAEYQVEANRQSTNRILAQTAAMSATLHSDLGVLNTNVSGLMKFNNEAMTTHIENSRTFYERQQQQMDEQTSILKEILEFQKSIYTPKSKSLSNKINPTDIFTSNGAMNLAEYFKLIRQNIKDMDSMGFGDLLSEASSGGGLKSFVSNPLGIAVTAAVRGIIPAVLKESFHEFNETISGSLTTAILKSSKMKDSNNPIISFLGNIFGVNIEKNNDRIDTSEYNKDATAWTGKDHKALVEVIPTLLNKIYSSISGEKETRYDYDIGQFVSVDSITKQFERDKNRYIKDANNRILPYFEKAIQQTRFESTERQKEFVNTVETILKENFKNMEIINPRNPNIDAKKYGLKGEHADEDIKFILRIFSNMSKHDQLQYSKDLLEAQEQYKKFISNISENGDDIRLALENNSISKNKKDSPIFTASQKLDETNELLREIRDAIIEKCSNNESATTKKKITNSEIIDNNEVKQTLPAVIPTLPAVISKSVQPDTKDQQTKNSYVSDLGMTIYTDKDASFTLGQDDIDSFTFSNKKNDKSYIYRLKKADKPSKKLFAFLSGTKELVQQPLTFFANILKKVDDRMYTLLFGSDKEGKNSILGKITDGIDIWIDDLKEVTKQKFDDIRDWLTGKDLKDKAHDIFSKLFGIDTREWFKDFRKSAFGDENTSFGEGVRKIFSEGFGDIWKDIKDTFKSDDVIKSAKDAILG